MRTLHTSELFSLTSKFQSHCSILAAAVWQRIFSRWARINSTVFGDLYLVSSLRVLVFSVYSPCTWIDTATNKENYIQSVLQIEDDSLRLWRCLSRYTNCSHNLSDIVIVCFLVDFRLGLLSNAIVRRQLVLNASLVWDARVEFGECSASP